jgi:membrane protein
MIPRTLWTLGEEAVVKFFDDSPFQFSAALSFYTVLSLSPLVLIVVAAAGLTWGEQPVRSELVSQIGDLITVRTVLERITLAKQSIGSVILGAITLLFGATTVFAQRQSSLNQIWGVKTVAVGTVTRRKVLWSLIRTRLLSLALVLVVGFLLLVSLLVSALLAAFHDYLSRIFPGAGIL